MEWPILILLGALSPLSDSLRTTGGTDLIAGWRVSDLLPPIGLLGLMMIAAMTVTPFLNNAVTVLVMAPIAADFATSSDTARMAFSWPSPSGRHATSLRRSDTNATSS